MSSNPTEIRETSPTDLQITWSDGHVTRYTYAWLREHCPCASCRATQREGGVDALLASMVRPDLIARDIRTVGRYALNIVFSDGHESGIFSFDLLRAECLCDACASSRAERT